MFKKIHLLTALGCVLVLSSVVLYFSDFPLPAMSLLLIAFFAATAEVSRYTSTFQFAIVMLSAALIGLILDRREGTVPWLTLAALLAGLTGILRIALFSLFSYTGYLWAEMLLAFLALGSYLSGLLLQGVSWQAHLFLSPLLIFAFLFGINTLYDNMQLLGCSRLGYQIKVNEPAKDFELSDQDGRLTRLSDYRDRQPVLLIFVRGDWCPMCHMMLRTYEKRKDEFRAGNVIAMAIGPDPAGVNKSMVEKLGIDFKVLSDEGQRTARVYGVQLKEYTNKFAPPQRDGIPLPASFLVDSHGIVRYVSSPERVGEYLNPALIFSVLENLGK